ncbi:MAG: C25 family cysteine peptidase [Candidatus Thermoplasmatota archaeon]
MKALAFTISLVMIVPVAVQKSNEDIFSGYTNFIYKEGYPVLPYKYETYVFPSGTEIKKIEVKEKNVEKIKLSKKIEPAPAPYPKKFEIKESEIYSKDEFYPSSWYEYEIHAGINNGKRAIFLTVYLYPFRYNALRNEILHAKDFDLKIDYVLPEKSEGVEAYDFLIISPDAWINELEMLKQHKESKGIKTIVVGLNEIYSGKYFSSYGRDDAEKIKYFIKNAIEEWGIKYVLLVGGRAFGYKEKWLMPVRYTNLDDKSGWEEGYLSDLYFADVYKYENGSIVFDDWDSNGNGIFAEWKGMKRDNLDLYPDVYVGRLACRNKYELKIMIDKIINYENKPFYEFNKFILVAGDSYEDSHKYIEGELATWEAYKYMRDFEGIKLWASEIDLSSKNIINAMNEGAGFAYFCGHGNPMSWSTHEPENFEEWEEGLQIFDMPFLRNDYKLPVVVIGGCHNSQFNVSIFYSFDKERVWKGENAPECWSWWLTRKVNGGAIATIGNTGLGYHGSEDENKDGIPDYLQVLDGWLEINFFRIYNEGIDILGMLHSQTLKEFIDYFPGDTNMPLKYIIDVKVVQEWLLLGDPTLKIGGYKE